MGQVCIRTIIEAVADSEGVEPDELGIVMADHIDLDAVNQLAGHDNSTWTLRFELPEHSVTVTSEGVILVDRQAVKHWMSA